MNTINVTSFDEVNIVLNRLLRRSQKSMSAVFSPALLMLNNTQIREDGLVGQCIIPCDGTLTDSSIYVPGVNKDLQPFVIIEIGTVAIKAGQKFQLLQESLSATLNWKVTAGAIMTVSIYPVTMKAASVSALFFPVISNLRVERYLHDFIEGATDERVRDAIDQGILTGITAGPEGSA